MKRTSIFIFLFVFVISLNAEAALIYYNDRTTFDLAAPGLVIEDFEESMQTDFAFPSPLDSTTNNLAFSPGDIEPGIAFRASSTSPTELVVLGPGVLGNPGSFIIGPNDFDDFLIISFPSPYDVFAVGFDALALAGQPTPTDISISSPSGGLGSTNRTLGTQPIFFGVISDSEPFDGISLYNINEPLGVMIDNVAFGGLNPIPEPTTMLLFGTGLIGLAGFRRRFKKS